MLFLCLAPQIPRRTNQSGLPMEFEKNKFSKNHIWEQWLPEVSESQRKNKYLTPGWPQTSFHLMPSTVLPSTGDIPFNEELLHPVLLGHENKTRPGAAAVSQQIPQNPSLGVRMAPVGGGCSLQPCSTSVCSRGACCAAGMAVNQSLTYLEYFEMVKQSCICS